MRTVLIGAVGSTEIILRAMHDADQPPVLVATLSPEVGRERHADYVDLGALATAETQLIHVDRLTDAAYLEAVERAEPDVIFVVGWSQMVGPKLRASARRYCIGFHPTLLPALRGRAAIGWTILLGLRETGATLFEIADDVDSGPVLAQDRIALSERENVGSLAAKLSSSLNRMIRDLLPKLADGSAVPVPQNEDAASYCARRTSEDNLIDWTASTQDIDRLIRASSAPYSGAFTFTRKRRVTIWAAVPWQLPYAYHSAAGQIVEYVEGDPVVRCGDGGFLRITHYEADEFRLSGQVKFRSDMERQTL